MLCIYYFVIKGKKFLGQPNVYVCHIFSRNIQYHLLNFSILPTTSNNNKLRMFMHKRVSLLSSWQLSDCGFFQYRLMTKSAITQLPTQYFYYTKLIFASLAVKKIALFTGKATIYHRGFPSERSSIKQRTKFFHIRNSTAKK